MERPQTDIADGRPGRTTLTSTNADAPCPRRGTEHHAEPAGDAPRAFTTNRIGLDNR